MADMERPLPSGYTTCRGRRRGADRGSAQGWAGDVRVRGGVRERGGCHCPSSHTREHLPSRQAGKCGGLIAPSPAACCISTRYYYYYSIIIIILLLVQHVVYHSTYIIIIVIISLDHTPGGVYAAEQQRRERQDVRESEQLCVCVCLCV